MGRPITKLKGIENAAIGLFAKRRVTPVTIKDIAHQAGCAEGTLYRHYKSKDEMVWALHRREVEKFGARLKAVLQGQEPVRHRIRLGVEVFFSFFDEDPVTFTFILLSQHHFPPERKLDPAVNPINLVFNFVREGVEAGLFHIDDPQLGAAMVLGLVLQPATMRVTGRLQGPLVKRVEAVTEACLKILQIEEEQGYK